MSENKFNNIKITKSLDDEVFFYVKPLSPEKLKKPLKNKVFYVKVVFYDSNKEELLVDYPKDIKVRDVTEEDKEFFTKKEFKYELDIIISHKFNIKDFLLSKGFKEKKDNENEEDLFLEDVKYISCWIDANNDEEISVEYNEEVVAKIVKCYCYRDFTVDEVKKIVKELRDSEDETKGNYDLLTRNTEIPQEDRTYERFTEELNKTFRKYEINTCLRKIHFLAQAYTESNGFKSTKEEGSEQYLKSMPYYPYIGRGFLQLTWEGLKNGEIGYKQYFEYLAIDHYSKDYNLINNRLDLAFDVSGYFWTRGKLLNKGKTLKSKYPNLRNQYKIYNKTKIEYPKKYTTINLNEVADDDNILQITYLVNGEGMYHINKRKRYTNILKGVFNCENKK